MFNPEEYSLNRDNNFVSQAIPGLSSPLLQFAHGNLRTLDMELLFDTYEKRTDVRQETEKLIHLMEIDPALHAPPVLIVAWASLQFRCVLTRANQKFLLFLDDGRPVRARIHRQLHRVHRSRTRGAAGQARDGRLHQAAHRAARRDHHRHCQQVLHRPDACGVRSRSSNDIDNPRELLVGQALIIPSLLVRQSGDRRGDPIMPLYPTYAPEFRIKLDGQPLPTALKAAISSHDLRGRNERR